MVRLARLKLLTEEGRDEGPASGISTISALAAHPDTKPYVSISGDRANIIQKIVSFCGLQSNESVCDGLI